MKKKSILILSVVVLFFNVISESWAAKCISNGFDDTNGILEGTATPCNSCGVNCNWEVKEIITNGKTETVLSVTAKTNPATGSPYENVSMKADFGNHSKSGNSGDIVTNAPWGDQWNTITNVNIGEGITKIGQRAFQGLSKVTAAYIPSSVTRIEGRAFDRMRSLTNVSFAENSQLNSIGERAFQVDKISIFELPDSLVSLGELAFNSSNQTTIIIPDTIDVNNIGYAIFGNDEFNNKNIICRGQKFKCDVIRDFFENYTYTSDGGEKTAKIGFSVAGFAECSSMNYYWNGAECVREPNISKRKCCNSCKDMGGYCNRIRYTPAEAAEILNDDDNEITITFKK